MSYQTALHQIYGLYGITDPILLSDTELLTGVSAAIKGGLKVLQYRNKKLSVEDQYQQALALSELCRQHQVCFIINDNYELALKVGADGVHIGKDDGRVSAARSYLGADAIVGVSCYNDISNAKKAISEGASYVAFGRFFPSKTKPQAVQAKLDLIKEAREQLAVPVVAIGGINRENATQLIARGAHSVAVIHDLFHNMQSIYETAKAYHQLFADYKLKHHL